MAAYLTFCQTEVKPFFSGLYGATLKLAKR
jgi:hypothetical protein